MSGRESLRERLAALESKISNLRGSSARSQDPSTRDDVRKKSYSSGSVSTSSRFPMDYAESSSSSSSHRSKQSLAASGAYSSEPEHGYSMMKSQVLLSAMFAELEGIKKKNSQLEERNSLAEQEISLLRADKSSMVQALNYNSSMAEEGSIAEGLGGEQAAHLVQMVRAENAELLDMVAEQHAMVAQHKSRAVRAERELLTVHSESEILRRALQEAEGQVEGLLQEIGVMELEMEALRLKQECEAGAETSGTHQLILRASANVEEVNQAASALASMVAMSANVSSSQEDHKEAQRLVMKQQDLLRQQQEMMLALFQKSAQGGAVQGPAAGQGPSASAGASPAASGSAATVLVLSSVVASMLSAGAVFMFLQQRSK